VHLPADAVAAEVDDDRIARRVRDLGDGRADVAEARAVADVSPWKPSIIVVTSTFTMSPSRRTSVLLGMPWHTISFRLVHTAAGNPLYPSWLGTPPRLFVSSRTQRSISAVAIPARRRAPIAASVSAAIRPARRRRATSASAKSSIAMPAAFANGRPRSNTVSICPPAAMPLLR
jgi:hypothetical protein